MSPLTINDYGAGRRVLGVMCWQVGKTPHAECSTMSSACWEGKGLIHHVADGASKKQIEMEKLFDRLDRFSIRLLKRHRDFNVLLGNI